MVEPADDFDGAQEEAWSAPLLPPEDRLWRHPSELGDHAVPVSAEALSARRSWMASTPSRAGAWSAGIVGALLATGVVLIGGHLTHLLSPNTKASGLTVTNNITSSRATDPGSTLAGTTTTLSIGPSLYKMALGISPAMPMVFVDHKLNGVGIVVNSKGYVLVPASLIGDSDDIGIYIDGQGLLPATLVGVDTGTGLAVVRVHALGSLTAIRFVSDTEVGSGSFVGLVWVDGAGAHACWGSVSGLDVKLSSNRDSPPLLETLQTMDTPGGVAMGGVIVDGAGRPIGMVTASSGDALVATPGWLAEVVSDELISGGRVVHGWLGITGQTAALSPSETAVKVLSVSPGGAAAKAGVRAGDMIEAVNGEPTRTMSDMVAALYPLPPDRNVTLDLDRHGRILDARARLSAAA
ncbi:MAG: PDZ domain-containing protein [Acidimicrobiales bacterium]